MRPPKAILRYAASQSHFTACGLGGGGVGSPKAILRLVGPQSHFTACGLGGGAWTVPKPFYGLWAPKAILRFVAWRIRFRPRFSVTPKSDNYHFSRRASKRKSDK